MSMKCSECNYNWEHSEECSWHPTRIMFREYHDKLIAAFEQLPDWEHNGRPIPRSEFLKVLRKVKP